MSKDGKKILLFGLFIMALILAGCNSDSSSGGGSGNAQQLSATAANFDEVFKSVIDKPGNYVINLTGDVIDHPGIVMETAGVNITVKGTGSNKITWKYTKEADCSLFNVNAGKLTLENISLNRGDFNTPDWHLLWINGGTIEIKSGVVLNSNNGSQYFRGISGFKGTFIMSGGTIENCSDGVLFFGDGPVAITMSGGTIRSNTGSGIGTWGVSKNQVITISGGTISGNGGNGVTLGGTENSLSISGGNISNNGDCGIGLWEDSKNCVVDISGGAISGNGGRGVAIGGNGDKFTMSGGTIGKNGEWGLHLYGANSEFEKKKGGVIYGGSGDNKNGAGAILVSCNKKELVLGEVDAGKDEVYAAKINSGQTDIVEGSKQGPNW
jgi:hypothetical protein